MMRLQHFLSAVYEMLSKLTSLGDTKWVTLTGKISPGTGSGGNVYEGKTWSRSCLKEEFKMDFS